MKVLEWLKTDNYLPNFIKDFHDQKDVFKLLDRIVNNKKKEDRHNDLPNWIGAHIYTIDIFLWCMAFYGYKLQKVRAKNVVFGDLDNDIKKMKDETARQFLKMVKGVKSNR